MRRATVKNSPVPSELRKEAIIAMGRTKRGVIQLYNENTGPNKTTGKANMTSVTGAVRVRILFATGKSLSRARGEKRGILLPRFIAVARQ